MAEKMRIPYTVLICHRSCISQNTIDPYKFCAGQIGVQNNLYPLCFISEKQMFWQRWSCLSIDCNSVRQFLCRHDRFAFRNWRYSDGYNNTWFYPFTNMPQFISIDLIDTEQIELKCNHPLLTEDKIGTARPRSISNNSSRKFQALTSSLEPADSLAPKYYLDLSLS